MQRHELRLVIEPTSSRGVEVEVDETTAQVTKRWALPLDTNLFIRLQEICNNELTLICNALTREKKAKTQQRKD